MTIPELQTERLILRGHTLEDFPAHAALWGDAEVTRFIGGAPASEEDAWSRFLRNSGQWAMLGFGFWAVVEKATSRFIGQVGFVEAYRAIEPPLKGIPEAGWAFAPSVHGKGYAFEASVAAIAWGEKKFGNKAMRCIIAPDNAPSLRLAERLGFKELLHTTYKGEPTIMFERPAHPR